MDRIRLVLIIILIIQYVESIENLDCNNLDNGQSSDNPVFKESDCSSKCFVCQTGSCKNNEEFPCSLSACSNSKEEDNARCDVDGYVGSYVILENESVRIWNFTLKPGEMTSMHRHDYDYSFVAVKPSQLEVFGEDGTRLFDFWATETSLRINGDYLEPFAGNKLPYKVPRVHAARNIGKHTYHEILFEHKYSINDRAKPQINKVEL
jgi:hypothetical protein